MPAPSGETASRTPGALPAPALASDGERISSFFVVGEIALDDRDYAGLNQCTIRWLTFGLLSSCMWLVR